MNVVLMVVGALAFGALVGWLVGRWVGRWVSRSYENDSALPRRWMVTTTTTGGEAAVAAHLPQPTSDELAGNR